MTRNEAPVTTNYYALSNVANQAQSETIASALRRLVPLMSDTPERRRQIEAFRRLDEIMAIGSASSSAKAADIVLDMARRGRGGERDAMARGEAALPC